MKTLGFVFILSDLDKQEGFGFKFELHCVKIEKLRKLEENIIEKK